jgi:hypothetical protein
MSAAGGALCQSCGLIAPDTVVYGRVVDRPHVNFAGFNGAKDLRGQVIDRSYARFMCADQGADDRYEWFDDGALSDPPDGDINLD